jgi:hypothetical protein
LFAIASLPESAAAHVAQSVDSSDRTPQFCSTPADPNTCDPDFLQGDLIVEVLFGLAAMALIVWFVAWRIWSNSWAHVKGKTLSMKAYVERYPQCSTGRGMRCATCGASSIKNWGFSGATDHRRLFICNHCNTRLYWSQS